MQSLKPGTRSFTSFWIPQVPGYLEAMTASALLGQVTDRVEIGSAMVPVQTRHPVPMAQQALTAQSACDGRFTLEIGPSHDWIVDGQLGLSYERPARLLSNYLRVLNATFTGPGSVDVENDTYRLHSPMDVAQFMPIPILLAALGPVMSGRRVDVGSHVPPPAVDVRPQRKSEADQPMFRRYRLVPLLDKQLRSRVTRFG